MGIKYSFLQTKARHPIARPVCIYIDREHVEIDNRSKSLLSTQEIVDNDAQSTSFCSIDFRPGLRIVQTCRKHGKAQIGLAPAGDTTYVPVIIDVFISIDAADQAGNKLRTQID